MQVDVVAEELKGSRSYEGVMVKVPASRFGLEDALQRVQVSEGGSYELH